MTITRHSSTLEQNRYESREGKKGRRIRMPGKRLSIMTDLLYFRPVCSILNRRPSPINCSNMRKPFRRGSNWNPLVAHRSSLVRCFQLSIQWGASWSAFLSARTLSSLVWSNPSQSFIQRFCWYAGKHSAHSKFWLGLRGAFFFTCRSIDRRTISWDVTCAWATIK